FAGFAPDGSLLILRHPSEGTGHQTALERWMPQEVPTAVPAEVLAAVQAPDSGIGIWDVPLLVFTFVMAFFNLGMLVLFMAFCFLGKAAGSYDVKCGWRGAVIFAYMPILSLLMISCGLYVGLTFFHGVPNWQWSDLFQSLGAALFCLIQGIMILQGELRAYH